MFQFFHNRASHLDQLVSEKRKELTWKQIEIESRRSEIAKELSAKIDDIEDPQMRVVARCIFLKSFSP